MPNKTLDSDLAVDLVGIDSLAYPSTETEAFTPFVPADVTLRELTPLAILFGIGSGLILGAASLYLLLKTGLTIPSSIAIAVTSISLFRTLSKLGLRNPSILEHNIAQSAGSASDAIAYGIGLTIPATLVLGFDLSFAYVVVTALIGGLLGVFLMIPLRRQFVVHLHGELKYPEAIATSKIAETLVDKGGTLVLLGAAISSVYYVLMNVFLGWRETAVKVFGPPLKKASVSMEVSPVLVGAGYIIGPRVAATMCAGGAFTSMVLIPLINFLGEPSPLPLAPASRLIQDMGPSELRGTYVIYIGAGAIVAAGVLSLARSLPGLFGTLKSGLADLRSGMPIVDYRWDRLDRDIPIKRVFSAVLALLLLAALLLFTQIGFGSILAAILIAILGFVYVSVSARLTGQVGLSLNPLTGLTVGTVLLTSLAFFVIGWTSRPYHLAALTIGAILGICVSAGGTTSQILKTGFLLGATPRSQQIAVLLGAIASAIVLGPLLVTLNESATIYLLNTSFVPVSNNAPNLIDPAELSSLPEYTGDIRPPINANYRIANFARSPAHFPSIQPGEYLLNETGKPIYKLERNFPPELRADVSELGPEQTLQGSQGKSDTNTYRLWQKDNFGEARPGRYLVNGEGVAVYLIDPGINGTYNFRPDGSRVEKFEAPRAVLLAYIVRGVLTDQLPWVLILFGIMLVVVLELCGVNSLLFAVGLYLPLSASMPLLVGGVIRALVAARRSRKGADDLAEKDEQSPGVLLCSGYIAGGALAAILFSVVAGWFSSFTLRMEGWAEIHNPFYQGSYANLLSLIPIAAVSFLLYLVASGRWFAGNTSRRR